MADLNKKNEVENDPVKRMLERLRQSVTDIPKEEPQAEPLSDSLGEGDTLPPWETSPSDPMALDEEEFLGDLEAIREGEGVEPIGKHDAADAIVDSEDVLDDAIISQFFQIEEEAAEADADDLTAPLPLEEIGERVTAEEVSDEMPDMSFLAKKGEQNIDSVASPEERGSAFSAISLPDPEEIAAEEETREKEEKQEKKNTRFFSPFDRPEPDAVPEEPSFVMHTEITDQETEMLFRSPRSDEEQMRRRAYRRKMREGSFVSENNEIPDAENGYAVEVELTEKIAPVAEPAKPEEAVAADDARPVDTFEADDTDDNYDGDFVRLLGKYGAAQEDEAVEVGKRNALRSEEDYHANPLKEGEQIRMDFDPAADTEPPSASREMPPATEPVVTPYMTQKREIFDDADTAEEWPDAPAEVEEAAAQRRFGTDEELEAAAAHAAEAPVAPRRHTASAARRKPKKKSLVSFFTFRRVVDNMDEISSSDEEYTSRNQIGRISRRFHSELLQTTVRIFMLSFLCVFLLLTENIALFGVTLGGIFADPAVAVSLDLLAVVLCFIASVPPVLAACRNLAHRKVVPQLFLTCSFLLMAVYDCLLYFTGEQTPRLFALIVAFFALVSAVSDHRRLKSDLSSFLLVASAGDKLAASVSSVRTTPYENAAVADLAGREEARIVHVRKIEFPTGFTARTARRCDDTHTNFLFLMIALGVSLIACVICGVLKNDLADAIAAFCLAFFASLPACLLILHTRPYTIIARRAAALRCAVVGEISAHEYSEAQAFTFEDIEAFPARNVRVKRIKLYGDTALDRVLYQVASAFSVVGGPLDGVFRSSTAELGLSSDAALSRAGEDGFAVAVDGREIMIGRGDYMQKNGIYMYYDAEDERQLAGGKNHILYAADNGRLIAKFYVHYKMDEDFEKDVERLHKKGVRTLLRTYDPNIRAEMIDKISYVGGLGLRVVRKTAAQLHDLATPRLNSGIVSRSSTRDVMRTVLYCRRGAKLIRMFEIFGMGVSAVGMLASVVLAALGLLPTFASVWFVLWQTVTLLPVVFGSLFYIGRTK